MNLRQKDGLNEYASFVDADLWVEDILCFKAWFLLKISLERFSVVRILKICALFYHYGSDVPDITQIKAL